MSFVRLHRIPDVAALDLTLRQLAVLDVVAAVPDIGVSGIAEKIDAVKPSVTRAIDKLVSFDIVSRVHDPQDRRCVRCNLTLRGRELWDSIVSAGAQMLWCIAFVLASAWFMLACSKWAAMDDDA